MYINTFKVAFPTATQSTTILFILRAWLELYYRSDDDRNLPARRIMSARLALEFSRQASLTVLGVAKGASRADVRAAYLRLVKIHHPDTAMGDKAQAEHDFKQIQAAYEHLSGRARAVRTRSAAEQYEDLQRARAAEPFIIRLFWRGPSIGTKFAVKLAIMVGLTVSAIVNDVSGSDSARRRTVDQRAGLGH